MNPTRRAVLAALLIALAVAAGQALAGIPNVELVTFLVFVAGALLGVRTGAIVGGLAIGFHSLFNVMGAAAPPVLVAQVVSYAIVGVTGGILGPKVARMTNTFAAVLVCAVTAGVLVVVFQVLVGVAGYLTYGADVPLAVYVWGGIAFTAVQLAWNAALFGVAMRPTLAVLTRVTGDMGRA